MIDHKCAVWSVQQHHGRAAAGAAYDLYLLYSVLWDLQRVHGNPIPALFF
jgi:hypothetical protein